MLVLFRGVQLVLGHGDLGPHECLVGFTDGTDAQLIKLLHLLAVLVLR